MKRQLLISQSYSPAKEERLSSYLKTTGMRESIKEGFEQDLTFLKNKDFSGRIIHVLMLTSLLNDRRLLHCPFWDSTIK
jgi:hypothetical protein